MSSLKEGTKPLNAELAQPSRPPASPTKIPQIRVWTRPTGIPRTPRHSAAHPGTPGKMKCTCPLNSGNPAQVQGFPCWWLVVRDRIELSTFRFSEGLSSTREPPFDAAPQPVYQHSGLSGACGSSLAGVPTCAGKCRLVRVTGVLASWDDRTCVALVLASWDRVPSTRAPPAQAPAAARLPFA